MCKQLAWLDSPVQRGHWRTHDGEEVDLILEREDGKVAALEVKAASRAPASELRGLLKLRSKLGSQLLGGVVLYTGTRAYTHDSGLHVIPINASGTHVARRARLRRRCLRGLDPRNSARPDGLHTA